MSDVLNDLFPGLPTFSFLLLENLEAGVLNTATVLSEEWA